MMEDKINFNEKMIEKMIERLEEDGVIAQGELDDPYMESRVAFSELVKELRKRLGITLIPDSLKKYDYANYMFNPNIIEWKHARKYAEQVFEKKGYGLRD